MRTINKICLVIVLGFLVFSCEDQTNEKVDYAILSGVIDSVQEGEIRISSSNGFNKDIKIKNNLFSDTLRIDQGVYQISYSRSQASIYLTQGVNVQIKANGNDYAKTVQYLGNHHQINNYFIFQSNHQDEFFGSTKENFAKSEDQFTDEIQRWRKENKRRLELLESFPTDLAALEEKHIDYGYLYMKQIYADRHGYYAKKKSFTISPEFKKELVEVSLGDEEAFDYSFNYRLFLDAILYNKTQEIREKDSLTYEMAKLKAVMETISNQAIKNQLLYDDIGIALSITRDKEEYYQSFIENSTDQKNNKEITMLYEELALLDKGKPSPTFNNYENHSGGTSSLSDYKGKYVYIDIWATWCGPCKFELPYLKQLEEAYESKNIEFVSISVDTEKAYEKWKKMVIEDEMTGVQLLADNDFESDFILAYKVRAIPRFILLDPDGKIVSSSAPRPSEDALTELFSELNI